MLNAATVRTQTALFADMMRKAERNNDQLIKQIQETRSFLPLCRLSEQNEEFAAQCHTKKLEDHWLVQYFELSNKKPLSPEMRMTLIRCLPEGFSLFEFFKGEVYYRAAQAAMERKESALLESALLKALENGSFKALRCYLQIILTKSSTAPFFEYTEENLLRACHYAREFAQQRLYGSGAYLLWAEVIGHLGILNSEDVSRRCSTMKDLLQSAEYFATHRDMREQDAFLRNFFTGKNDIFFGNTFGITSFKGAHLLVKNLETNHIQNTLCGTSCTQ